MSVRGRGGEPWRRGLVQASRAGLGARCREHHRRECGRACRDGAWCHASWVYAATGTCEHHDPAAPFGPAPEAAPYRWVTLALPAVAAVAAIVVTAKITDGHHPRPAAVLILWAAVTAALWTVMAWVRGGCHLPERRRAAARPAVPETYLRRLEAQRAADARQVGDPGPVRLVVFDSDEQAGAGPVAPPHRAPSRLEVAGPAAALAAAMPEPVPDPDPVLATCPGRARDRVRRRPRPARPARRGLGARRRRGPRHVVARPRRSPGRGRPRPLGRGNR